MVRVMLSRWAVLGLFGLLSLACRAGTVMYVANADSRDISVFSLEESSGQVALLQTLAVGGSVMPMALSPDRTRLYTALRSEPYSILVWAIDPASGRLRAQGSAALVDSMAHIALDPDGRALLAAAYGGNRISRQLLDGRGVPAAAAQVLATGAKPHQLSADPTNQFVYAALLGVDRLDYYRVNAHTGLLEPMPEPALQLPPGSGPRLFVFSANAGFIYLVGELDGRLYVLQRERDSGVARLLESHSLMPEKTGSKPWAADIHLTPNGQFVYASERASHSLSGFRVNPQSGRLMPIGRWATEAQPRAFNISPCGRFLVVVGQKSDAMTIYRINSASGELQLLARAPTGINPSWVEIIALPADLP